ncbi:hypothetical protein [Zoogloea ramigera]|uniref:hypothetical protein n=1 Tax=Zoogloea ramigera TaxID=350 RepID=UPI001143EFC5|nr:hypothetical protein [Zoogloea ramigera]
MHLSTTLSIRPRAAAPGKAPAADLLVDGYPAARTVPGAVLALAVVVGRRHLLFLTDDVPFEELLTVLLLGADLRPLDRAPSTAPPSAASIRPERLASPGSSRRAGWSLPSAATAPGPSKCSTPPGCGFRLCPTPRA